MSNQEVAPPLPFEVTSRHLAAVSKQMFPALLRRLLHAEADRHGIPADGIHVSNNIDVPNGGEDGRIQWTGEPERTPFLPGRFCQFGSARKRGPELRFPGRFQGLVTCSTPEFGGCSPTSDPASGRKIRA